MRFTFRLATVLGFFMPCVFFIASCNDGISFNIAYNPSEADSLALQEQRAIEVYTIDTNSTSFSLTTDSSSFIAPVNSYAETKQSAKTSFAEDLLRKILFPTQQSLSGIGVIFYYKNTIGKIAIFICLLISLILCIGYKWITSYRTTFIGLVLSCTCMTVFVIVSFFSHVSLLWGTWLILFLILAQLIIERRFAKSRA